MAPLLPYAIMGGASLISSILSSQSQDKANQQNAAAQKVINDSNIDFQFKKMFAERGWALSDFNTINQYNSPLQQMQRLREAGLNPNLVYGTGAVNTAGMIKSTQGAAPDLGRANVMPLPTPDLGGVLGQMYSLQQTQAQTDNLKATNINLQKDAILKDIAIGANATGASQKALQFKIDSTLQDTTVGVRKTELELKKQGLELGKQSMKSSMYDNLLKMAQTLEAKQRVEILQKEGKLKQLDINLRDIGLNPNDNVILRMIIQNLHKLDF